MIKIVYVMTSCKRCGPTQQTLNIIKNLDRNVFYPILITLYNEQNDTRISEYLQYVEEHYFIDLSKVEIMLHRLNKMEYVLDKIAPNIVHTVGVFPDYAVYTMKKYKQIHTIRNYVFDDYVSKFGFFRGNILALMQLKVIKSSRVKSIACSKSLQIKYKEEQNIDIRVRQNNPPQNVEPNENYVRELKDMGFPEDRARDALMRTGNDINRATDILLNGDDEDNNNNHNDEEDQNEEEVSD